MQLVVKRTSLQNALQIVARAVPARTTKPILLGVKISASDEYLALTAYDLELGIEVQIHNMESDEELTIQIEQPGEIVISAKYFLDIVRKLPHHLIRIDVHDLVVTLRSGAATYTLNAMDPREFPLLPEVYDDRGISMPADALKSMIDRAVFAVATSDSRPTLTGVLWHFEDGLLTFTSTDSHRLSTCTVTAESAPSYVLMDSIVPGKSLSELTRILPDTDSLTDIMIENNQLLARFERVKFYSRLVDGKYPDVSKIIPSNFCTTITADRKGFYDAIDRASLLARDVDNQVVRMYLRRTHIEISSQSLEIGKVSETIEPISFEGKDLLLACNARFLLQALAAFSSSNVRLEFTGSGSAFVLRSENDQDHLLQLILPVRIVG